MQGKVSRMCWAYVGWTHRHCLKLFPDTICMIMVPWIDFRVWIRLLGICFSMQKLEPHVITLHADIL